MRRIIIIAAAVQALAASAAGQDVMERAPGSIRPTDAALIDLPGTDADLWDQGPYNELNGLSNGVESAIGARRTLMFDFVIPPGQIWHIDGLRWRHVWETLEPGSGSGIEVRFRRMYQNRPSTPITDWQTSTTYEEYAVFQGRDAISIAGFEPVTLTPDTYWIEATIIGPENNFWRTADLANGTQVWVDYSDQGGFQRGENVFGVAYDITGILTGTAESAYTLTVSGDCPGRISVVWAGATPNRRHAVLIGTRRGAYRIPSGRCEGTVLGIESVILTHIFGTGPGFGERFATVGSHPCGWQMQLIESPSCNLTNVEIIP